ncbi:MULTISPECIES: protoporphyrinogen oxidase HemJ [Gammaproteobacteria]|uniref:Protoporphyrinogen IX oxidase n=1 Tax=Vreelandella halophila TaxID=86177 RepID=A0A9X4YFD2_9GAMM|nr:protoporphyrinogen oxidase HemJ [Halospina sp. K52047b]KAA8978008.1 protoporphyrinogen oxidase HemJ [Halospina sp. K52047b]MYL28028.1 protoporphyrinogen oxidase HemJ [Halomonas utahensis]MYL76164.1 protoporphyrinogen oxidase HemJ [Halomonas sp. 22501_18_FS]
MLWIKAFHLMAMVTWFAGIFYLPRLFVYHAMTEDEPGRERFRTMERKLYRGIMNPSMIATLIFGTWLIALNPEYYLQQGWLHIKLLLIAVLVAYHLWCGHFVRLFRDDRNTRGHIFFRWINEAPVLLLVAIILLAVLRPF